MSENDTPIIKSEGLNRSEMFLANYCEMTFLKLWAYPNPYGEQGKELCDVLVVFGEHIFIFSIKDISFNTEKSTEIAWERWKKKAIDKSIRQVKGAETWIRNNPENIFLDAQCTEKLPIPIDTKNWKFHRIVVAFGAEEACKNNFQNKINGSLPVCYTDLKDSTKLSDTAMPFGLILRRDDVIHVFDSHNLEIILGELDTVQDLLWYFEAKEEAIKKYPALSHCGEEDLLAHYLCNSDGEDEKFSIGEKDAKHDVLIIEQGLWAGLVKHASYQKIKKENDISYFWDTLLQSWSQYALDKKLINADILMNQLVLLEMAKLPRFLRKEFSEAIKGALEKYSTSENKNVQIRYFLLDKEGLGYIFLQTPCFEDEDYEKDYRPRRQTMLEIACGVLKSKRLHLKKIIGIAIEPPRPNEGSSQDFALLDCEEWAKENSEMYLKANKDLNLNFFEDDGLEIVAGIPNRK